ncbi:hypothetical protein [Nonomuraea zeae]|uniref:Uncharacterized protein n=1 Tax=Nonomuraea zeae TaxID=1642303 RepID=A0A5S4G966_9ACTN|nr:hypothetical protein [Nonomuraea zeae]TMR29483.1 hypothetical protein ETD85_32330 [Nonomuraea zeae]
MAPETSARQRLVQRICARVVPGMKVGVARLPSGGLQVRIDTPASMAEKKSWVLHHRMAREVALVGWHCEVDADRLLVLGWSAACLHNRVRLLKSGLRKLTDFEPTAQRAVQLDGRGPASRPAAELVADVCASIERRLRWPERLAELHAYERRSDLPHLQLRLAQVAGLEAQVAGACDEHLVMARVLAESVCERYARHGNFIHAQGEVLAEYHAWVHAGPMILGSATVRPGRPDASRPHIGPTQRRIAASAINHGVPRATPAVVTSGAGHADVEKGTH